MDPNNENQQPTQQPAGPHPQPVQTGPAPVAGPTPAAPAMAAEQSQLQQAAAVPAAPQQNTMTIQFEDDLKFEITSDVVDDMRFMDLYAEVSEDQLKIPKLMRFLLGADNYESIFTYYESKGQKFRITKFGEVFEKLDKDLNANPDFLRI